MSVNEMPKDEKPREKALNYGFNSLSNYELLAIIIGSGCANNDVLKISKTIINKAQNLKNLSSFTYNELIKFDGISNANATKILCLFEIAKRYHSEKTHQFQKLENSKQIFTFKDSFYPDFANEHLYVFLLDKTMNILSIFEEVSVDSVHLNINSLINRLILISPKYIIVSHNHKTKIIEPSLEDIQFTEKLEKICYLLSIKLLDHIIIGIDSYYSFMEQSLL